MVAQQREMQPSPESEPTLRSLVHCSSALESQRFHETTDIDLSLDLSTIPDHAKIVSKAKHRSAMLLGEISCNMKHVNESRESSNGRSKSAGSSQL